MPPHSRDVAFAQSSLQPACTMCACWPRWHHPSRLQVSTPAHNVTSSTSCHPQRRLGPSSTRRWRLPQPLPPYRRSCFGLACFSTPGDACWRRSSVRLHVRLVVAGGAAGGAVVEVNAVRRTHVCPSCCHYMQALRTGAQAQDHGAAMRECAAALSGCCTCPDAAHDRWCCTRLHGAAHE